MNLDNLHELINRYEEDIDNIYGPEHYELFKWKALKTWRDEWFKPEGSFACFADRFIAARKEFSLFIDNSRMHPSNGVIKLWEKEPETVEHLFCDVLFSDASTDPTETQKKMDQFLEEYEILRQKYYPGNWSFKQDRHSASVFLFMNDPFNNYVYKSSEALMMARCIGFDYGIGSGNTFSLPNYYRLCELIVSALNEHETLLQKHFDRLDAGKHYIDETLHLLAFDLMYCSRTYNYYNGLVIPEVRKAYGKKKTRPSSAADDLQIRAERRQRKITEIEQQIFELERSCNGCEDISLIGVQVSSSEYGFGTVVEQNINKITVQFSDGTKRYVLDKKYSSRPRFENDEEIVSAFTEYAAAREQIDRLNEELDRLR